MPLGKRQLEVDVLLDLGEPRVVGRRVRHRVDFDRLLAGEVPRGVERVDADVHQRAAAGHRLAEPPLRRVADVEAGVGQDHPRRPHLGGVLRHLDHRLVVRLVPDAVADHQLAAGRLGRRDHLLALLRRVGHRLLAQHVLAGLERADGVLGVHAVGQHDVDDVDVRVVRQAVVVVVGVDVLRVDAVHLRQVPGLLRPPAHEAHQLALLRSWRTPA